MNAVAWDNHVRCFDAAKGGAAQHGKNDCRCKDQEAGPSKLCLGGEVFLIPRARAASEC